jgi:hypothetical protein
MAIQQLDALQIGPFAPGSAANSSQVFSSTTTMGLWSSSISYAANNCVEYNGKVYRSLAGSNLNNQPDTSPASWTPILNSVKDGDVCLVVAGLFSDINIRQNGIWQTVLGVPVTVSLPNNTSGLAVRFPLSIARAATIQYSIKNGAANRVGTLRYNSDGTIGPTGVSISDTNNVDQGGDVGITFDADVDGTGMYVELNYTSTDLNVSPATFQYTIQRWT